EAVEDVGWGAAAHVVAVVATAVVVAHQPGVGLGLQLADAGEAATVERRPPALLQRGAVEAFTDRVVVRRARWDAVMLEPAGGQVGPKARSDPLGSVVGEHGPHRHAEAPVAAHDM